MLSPGSDSAVEVELFTPPTAVLLPAPPEGTRKARFPRSSGPGSDTSASSAKPRVKVLTPTASRLREEGEYLLALTLLDFCLWHG